jgi:hypothetical protein
VNGDASFDPEVEFDSAVKAMGEMEGHTGEIASARRADAQLQLLAVVAHQLGSIARYYERCEKKLLDPIVDMSGGTRWRGGPPSP